MEEELGLQVKALRKVADVHFQGNLQVYFLVEKIGGEFGTGTGEEFGEFNHVHGSYQPIWMELSEVLNNNVLPRELAELTVQSVREGWPAEAVIIIE